MYKRVKGTRDFYPDELDARKKIFSKIREIVQKFGFNEVEAPAIESFSLLSAKQGEEIRKQIFVLEKRGKEDLGLRFDLTIPLTRMFSAVQISAKKPVKWFALSRMWRYEQPQKGRLREFYQLSVELFGSNRIEADFEVLSLAIKILESLGLTEKDFKFFVNNRKFLEGFLETLNVKNINEVFHVIDGYTKKPSEQFVAELKTAGLNEEQIKKILISMEASLDSFNELDMNAKMREGFSEIKELFSLLEYTGLSKYVEFKSYIARGLDYYTGTVFECFDIKQKYRAILGGGRYNNLVKQLGAQDSPAVGFGLGDVTLELLLREKSLWPDPDLSPDYFIAPVNQKMIRDALNLAMSLRLKNKVEVDLLGRKLAKQLFYAHSIGAKKVIIMGEDEFKEGKVVVRDMKTGIEVAKRIEELV